MPSAKKRKIFFAFCLENEKNLYLSTMINARTPRFLSAEEKTFVKSMYDQYRWSDCQTGKALREADRVNNDEFLRLRGDWNAARICKDEYRAGRQLADIRLFNVLISL